MVKFMDISIFYKSLGISHFCNSKMFFLFPYSIAVSCVFAFAGAVLCGLMYMFSVRMSCNLWCEIKTKSCLLVGL